jgi:rhodanese-related sulfurtransferase
MASTPCSFPGCEAVALLALAAVLGFAYNASSPLGVRATVGEPAPSARPSAYANETLALAVEPVRQDAALRNETISAEIVSGGAPAAAKPPALVTWPEAREIVARGGGLLVDARGAGAFAAGHIPGAVSLPFTLLESRMPQFAALHPRTVPIVVYCADTECPVSAAEARDLREHYGYLDVREMPGGYAAWRLAEEGGGQ